MRIFKRILVPVIFIAVLFAVNTYLNYLLVPYTFTRYKIHKIETETFDDLILGSSHAGTCLAPSGISSVTGRSAFNAAQGEEYPVDSYFFLKDAAGKHKPDRLIYEFDPNYWITAQDVSANYAGTYTEMQPGKAKVQYFFAKMWKADFRTSIAPWYFYRAQLSDIERNLFVKRSDDYKNFGTGTFDSATQTVEADGFIAVKPGKWEDEIIPRDWSGDMIQEKARDYFIRIAEFCSREGIELVVVTTPVPAETLAANEASYASAGAEMEALSRAYDFTYMNYTAGDLLEARREFTDSELFADWDGHMYADAARRFSVAFAEDLENA